MINRVFKKVIICMFMITSVIGVKAQSAKVGYLDYSNVVLDMPEYKVMNDSLMSYYLELQEDLKKIEDDYMKKQAELSKKIDAGEQNKRLLELEQYALEQIQQIYQYQQRENEEKLTSKQEELLEPLKKKVDDAVGIVAKEKGFTMIIDASVLHFKRDVDDVENMVRAKLKIITKEESEKKRKEGLNNNSVLPINPMGN